MSTALRFTRGLGRIIADCGGFVARTGVGIEMWADRRLTPTHPMYGFGVENGAHTSTSSATYHVK